MPQKPIFLLLLIASFFTQLHAGDYSLIPKPLKVESHEGHFTINPKTEIVYFIANKGQKYSADYLASIIKASTGYDLTVEDAAPMPENNFILFNYIKDESLGNEGYELSIEPDKVFIEANTDAGLFYGMQSLLQLLPPKLFSQKVFNDVDWSVPCMMIKDKPRFSWRGMHLDVCRHFFPKEFVKKYIDILAMYKMNTFHWHLTDDQGWRIEIKKYPKLTEVGAWRKETMGDNTRYSGFYTQEEIKEVIQYAKERFITIVPEIEMPGHSLAAVSSYPELSCTGGPFEVGTEWGVFDDVYCAGNEKTYEFLQDVIDEVCALFPGQYFHIGGDECPKTRWNGCPKCQARIKAEHLKDGHELQSYFVTRIEKMLNAKGKHLVGWDEILEGGLAPNATVMSWRGTDGGIAAAKAGHDVVMTPGTYCYFDHYQSHSGEPKAIGGFLPLDSVYAYEPVPYELSKEESKHILGAQGNLWTEYISTSQHVEYMILPRLCAMSEVDWTEPSGKNYNEFLYRLESHYERFDLMGYNYRIPTPQGIAAKYIISKDSLITIESPISSATIYYTLDGSEPTNYSLKYELPLLVNSNKTIKSKVMLQNGKMSSAATTQVFKIDQKVNGLQYSYYEGEFDSLPDFSKIKPEASGKVYDLDLSVLPHRDDNFAVMFSGMLSIEKKGEYTLYLNSDDGSKLYLDNKLLINNDYLHGSDEKKATVTLLSGKHKLVVEMFERTGDESLSVSIEGAELPKQLLSPKLFMLK